MRSSARSALSFAIISTLIFALFPVCAGVIVTLKKMQVPQTYMVQSAFMVAAVVTMLIYGLRDRRVLSGLYRMDLSQGRLLLWFVPLILSKTGYLSGTFQAGHAGKIALFALSVGIAEEILFRGLILKRLSEAFPIRRAMVVSAVLFGFVHAAQALSGAGFLSVFLSILNALLFGLIAAPITVLNKSLIPTILWHTAFNFINWTFVLEPSRELRAILIQSVILSIYALWLWKRSTFDQKN